MQQTTMRRSVIAFSRIIPRLNSDKHKGSCGRVGVIGGSLEYTGAPYFAAISALKAGADLVHVFCCQAAGPVIKSYSPELIVHPLLDTNGAVEDIGQWVSRLDSLVVGPGLGRDRGNLETVRKILENMPKSIPVVLDADGIFMLTENGDLMGIPADQLIITPNAVEYQRMRRQLVPLPPAVYILKGATDKIMLNDEMQAEVTEVGSFRRCGGQGDVLAGLMGAFSAWTKLSNNSNYVDAAVAASILTRRCALLAFTKHGRSMIASNLIEALPSGFTDLFDEFFIDDLLSTT